MWDKNVLMTNDDDDDDDDDDENRSERKLWEAMDMFMASMVGMVSQTYIYPQIHWVCIH